jgi:hypothetical protein
MAMGVPEGISCVHRCDYGSLEEQKGVFLWRLSAFTIVEDARCEGSIYGRAVVVHVLVQQ